MSFTTVTPHGRLKIVTARKKKEREGGFVSCQDSKVEEKAQEYTKSASTRPNAKLDTNFTRQLH